MQEVEIAKNYLDEQELNILNRMVTAYLEVAELQALNQVPMYMKDWKARLDDFLKMTGKEVLTHAGTVSHDEAMEKARLEYDKYAAQIKNQLSQVEKDFIKAIDQTEKKNQTEIEIFRARLRQFEKISQSRQRLSLPSSFEMTKNLFVIL